jgi:hypothetical protein
MCRPNLRPRRHLQLQRRRQLRRLLMHLRLTHRRLLHPPQSLHLRGVEYWRCLLQPLSGRDGVYHLVQDQETVDKILGEELPPDEYYCELSCSLHH